MQNISSEKKPLKRHTRKPNRTIEDDLFLTGLLSAVVAAWIKAATLLFPALKPLFHLPPCLFHLISGYYCPGCGGTRAVRALLRGQFLQSFFYHPFVPYAAAVYIYFMATQTAQRASHGKYQIGMHYQNSLVWIAVALIIGNFILKNTLHYFYGWSFESSMLAVYSTPILQSLA